MKLTSFSIGGKASFGIVTKDGIIDLGRRLGAGAPTLRALIAADALAKAADLAGGAPDHELEDIAFDPVIPDPGKIICVGMNYRDHTAEVGREVTEKPTLFARFAGSQVGHGQPMIRPAVSEQFDYEGELAIIIGRGGHNIAPGDAYGRIAGYACYNDGSIRDWQRHTTQFLPGKNFTATGAFGPWMVTPDELPHPDRLKLETRLNGARVQSTTTDLMINDIPTLLAYCSTIIALDPGDVIVTGTPGGVGARRTPPLWMKPGDIVEVEIEGVGVLSNPIVQG
jgi:2-keto-4-pentenoate hydratase/2-oxohepta-3-ene-1,7-dioic acid hydratase in catechol pathway